MLSLARMGIFEQAAKLPMIDSKEMSLLLRGLDPYIKIKEIPEDKLADFRSYRNFIKCFLTFQGGGEFFMIQM